LLVGAALAFASTNVLMQACQETGHDTYAGLFAHCTGGSGGAILDVMLVVYGNGACVGFMVFLSDFVPSLVTLVFPSSPAWLASRWFAIFLAVLIILPLAVQRDLAVLRFVTPMSIAALVYMAMTVAIKSAFRVNSNDPARGDIRFAIASLSLPEAFSVCVFAFNCHINVVPVAGNMVRATKARIFKVSAMVNLVQLTFYLLIGVTGYLSFLEKTPQDIVKAYPDNDVAVAVGRFMLTGSMLVGIPINIIPTVRSGLQLVGHLCPRLLGDDGPLLTDASAASAAAANSELSVETSIVQAPTLGRPFRPQAERVRVLLSICFLLMQAFLAIKVPGVVNVLSLLGATVVTAMMMAIPAYCMGRIQTMTPKNRMLQITFYFFSLVSLASVPIKILTWCTVI